MNKIRFIIRYRPSLHRGTFTDFVYIGETLEEALKELKKKYPKACMFSVATQSI